MKKVFSARTRSFKMKRYARPLYYSAAGKLSVYSKSGEKISEKRGERVQQTLEVAILSQGGPPHHPPHFGSSSCLVGKKASRGNQNPTDWRRSASYFLRISSERAFHFTCSMVRYVHHVSEVPQFDICSRSFNMYCTSTVFQTLLPTKGMVEAGFEPGSSHQNQTSHRDA